MFCLPTLILLCTFPGWTAVPFQNPSVDLPDPFAIEIPALQTGVIRAVDRRKILNLRADVAFASYANTRRRIPFANTGGLVQLDLWTSSNIVSVVAGPQLLGPTGAVTPYATALGGFSVFWTESTVEGSQNVNTPFASTTNSADAVLAYGGSGGAYWRIVQGRRPVRLDVAVRYLRHDDVRYLTDERVTAGFRTNTEPVPVRGRADMVTYSLGVTAHLF